MAEYIDREAALKRFEEIKQSGISLKDAIYIDGVMAVIETLLAADVEPVRHGRWIGKRLDNFKKYQVTCSECGWIGIENYDSYVDPSDFNYCPNCGANMEYEEDDL